MTFVNFLKGKSETIIMYSYSIIIGCYLTYIIEYRGITHNEEKLWIIATALVTVILPTVYVLTKKANDIKKYAIFLATIGLLITFVNAPFCTPDEPSHFARVYEISEGKIISGTNEDGRPEIRLPEGVYNGISKMDVENSTYHDVIGLSEISNNRENNRKPYYTAASLYAPIVYMPQAVGVFLARLFSSNVLCYLYVARIMNMLVGVALLTLAMCNAKELKNYIFAISIIPMVVHLLGSVAPDVTMLSTIILFVSIVINKRYYEQSPLSTKEKIALIMLCLIISTFKIVYIPILLTILLIPADRFYGFKAKCRFVGVLACACAIVGFGWYFYSMTYKVVWPDCVNVSDQFRFIAENPHYVVYIMERTFSDYSLTYVVQMFGGHLNWLNVAIPSYLIVAFIVFFMWAMIVDDGHKIESKRTDKALVWFVVLAVVLGISMSLYMSWTEVGAPIISGIQGRYFLPLLILLPILIGRSGTANKPYREVSQPMSKFFVFLYVPVLLILVFNNMSRGF